MVYINVLGTVEVIGATVTVVNSAGQPVFTGITNAQFYVSVELPENNFTATASKTGFITQHQTFNGSATSIVFNMVKETTPPPENGGAPATSTITWIAIGAISLVAAIGAILYLKRKR